MTISLIARDYAGQKSTWHVQLTDTYNHDDARADITAELNKERPIRVVLACLPGGKA